MFVYCGLQSCTAVISYLSITHDTIEQMHNRLSVVIFEKVTKQKRRRKVPRPKTSKRFHFKRVPIKGPEK